MMQPQANPVVVQQKKKKKRVTPVSVPTVVNSSLLNAQQSSSFLQKRQQQQQQGQQQKDAKGTKNPLSMVGSTTSSANGPAPGSVYAFELDVRDGQREFVLSELHPMGFPKRRRATGERDMAKIAARLKADSLAAAKAAYRAFKAKYKEKKGRTAFEIFVDESGEKEKARLSALSQAPDDPAPGWRRIAGHYVAPNGEVVRSTRDVRKYIDRHLKSTRTSMDGKPLRESHFRFGDESPGEADDDRLGVDHLVLKAWESTVDRKTWEDMALAEQSLAAQTNQAAEDQARKVAAEAASSVGVDTATAAYLAADAHKADAVVQEPKPIPRTHSAEAVDLASDEPAAAVVDATSSTIPNPVPKTTTKKKKKKAPVPNRRYNVVERLERLFGGGELAESGDEEDSESVISYYASDDSFIDDSEIVKTAEEREEAARTKPAEFQGFFASTGELATETVNELPAKKKLKTSKLKRSRSFGDDGSSSAISAHINDKLESDAPLSFVQANPKRGESAIRYEAYKSATSYRRALDLGATKADLRNDLQKGYIKEKQKATHTLPAKKKQKRPPDGESQKQTLGATKESSKKKVAPTPVLTAARKTPSTAIQSSASPQRLGSFSSSVDGPAKMSSTSSIASATSVAVMKKKPAARRMRCGKCAGCLAEECGVCKMCLDRPKRGGENKYRQPCVRRACVNFSSSAKQNATATKMIPPLASPTPPPATTTAAVISGMEATQHLSAKETSGSSHSVVARPPPVAGASNSEGGEKPVAFVTQS